MEKLAVLLRGVNLGSHNRISMPEFKKALEELDLHHVATYLQSGNAIAEGSTNAGLAEKIKKKLVEKYHLEVEVLLKTQKELEKALRENPFRERFEIEPTFLYVTFLAEIPSSSLIEKIEAEVGGSDKWSLIDSTIYLYCPGGYGRTKLTNTFFEKKLKVAATTRNLKTVTALVELMKEI